MNAFAGPYGYRDSHKNLVPGVTREWALAWRTILMSLIPVCSVLATPFSREYLSNIILGYWYLFKNISWAQGKPMPYFSSWFSLLISVSIVLSQKFHLQSFVSESWFVYFRSLLEKWNAKVNCHMPSLLFFRGGLFFQNHWLIYEKLVPQQLQ